MRAHRPQFELARIPLVDPDGEPEILPVLELPGETQMNRRGFLGTALTTSAALLALNTGCASKNAKYKWTDEYGVSRTATQRCGSPIPTGAICTCNCVPVYRAPTTRTICTCNKVCTCVPVYR